MKAMNYKKAIWNVVIGHSFSEWLFPPLCQTKGAIQEDLTQTQKASAGLFGQMKRAEL